tara:strand:- start:494 stop:775 length:282 start_codon:yes stop_codon:yes gene_type:complete
MQTRRVDKPATSRRPATIFRLVLCQWRRFRGMGRRQRSAMAKSLEGHIVDTARSAKAAIQSGRDSNVQPPEKAQPSALVSESGCFLSTSTERV